MQLDQVEAIIIGGGAGEVLACACASRLRERAAYGWIAEISIDMRADAHHHGIARWLYGVLLGVMRLQGTNQTVSVITLPDTVSVALHEAMGFGAVGVWRQCGYQLCGTGGMWGMWGMWQEQLQPAANPPAVVMPFPELLPVALQSRLEHFACSSHIV